jgi:hypothetical protein
MRAGDLIAIAFLLAIAVTLFACSIATACDRATEVVITVATETDCDTVVTDDEGYTYGLRSVERDRDGLHCIYN